MVKTESPDLKVRSQDSRSRILDSARSLVSEGGWQGSRVADVAEAAGIATGTVYRYFESKTELFTEVLSRVSQREVDVLMNISKSRSSASTRLHEAVKTFVKRAMDNPRLAYALIAEPCDKEIDEARLIYRSAISEVISAIVASGQKAGEMRKDIQPNIAASFIVGGFMEGLIGPLSPLSRERREDISNYQREVAMLGDEITTLACASVVVAPATVRQSFGDTPMNKPISFENVKVSDNRYSTHKVLNQAQPASGFNAFTGDTVLREAIEREAPWAAARCESLGAAAGDEHIQELAHLANRHLPELKTHDRFGNRIDWVEFHPSWHELMSLAWKHEVPNLAWTANEAQPHYARAALSYLWNQVEQGTSCPTGQTYASYAGFQAEPALKIWAEKACGTQYEFSRNEVAQKPSIVIGYAMTEKQGGSDLRETQTTATFSHSADYHGATAYWYELTGHKWFCSVPQSDGFFTLAKVNGGVTCFFLPRTLPDGSYNRFFIQRLKDKSGNRSNASSEIEYCGTLAIRVGEEGKGIREILSHSHLTRLDFAIGSAGLMRQSLNLALQHTTTRKAFSTSIADRPMMTNVLADMAVEVEAATLFALRVAKATDHLETNEQERLLARMATPAAKYFNCSRVPSIAYEALQCHGGNGFIEENPMARLYREAPLNSVWEGTANMMCMDARRAMLKDPRTIDALFEEVRPLAGQDARFDAMIQHTKQLVKGAVDEEFLARPMTEAVARLLQGAELLRHSTDEVVDTFLATRAPGASGSWGSHYGTMALAVDQAKAKKIVRRASVIS